MNSKITRKLVLYFLTILLLFSLVSGVLFFLLGKKSIEESSTKYLEDRGKRIALFISNIMEENSIEESNRLNQNKSKSSNGNNREYRPRKSLGNKYLKWVNELLETDIKIVSKSDKSIEVATGKKAIYYESLNKDDKKIVNNAFEGKISHVNKSSIWDNSIDLTLAAPVRNNGKIISVILIDEKNSLTHEFLETASKIFVMASIVGAILVALLAIIFANRFISPLKKLDKATDELIKGNYKVTSNIDQDDEIGNLASKLDNLAQRLEEARIQSESISQMKDDFISSMSHELKTPVTVLKASLEALNSGIISDPGQVDEYHHILFNEIGFLEKLINDLMELNILKNNKFQMNKEEINILEVLNDSIRSQSLLAREKNIVIEKEYKDSILMFNGDYTRIRQLFITIINNAIKYSNEGSNINIKETINSNIAVISVDNIGQSIEKSDIDHIFEPFYRDKKTDKKGFGLGLAIAKEIADKHNIKILVKRNNQKTIFELAFVINHMI